MCQRDYWKLKMSFLDTVIIIVVSLVGLFILYKALKEPLDLLGNLIKKGFMGIINSFKNKKEDYYETITYG